MANNIITITQSMKYRTPSQVETTIQKFPLSLELSYQEWDWTGTRIKSTDNLVSISKARVENPKFLYIIGQYLTDDNSLPVPVKAGDLAPFKVKLDNSSNTEMTADSGIFFLAGAFQSLWVATDYENDIELSIYFAG